MSGAQQRHTAAVAQGDRSRRRYATALPFVVLALAVGIMWVLAEERSRELAANQTQYDEVVRHEFALEAQESQQNVHTEIDRLVELISGIRAYAATYTDGGWPDLAGYLDLNEAETRFPAMILGTVHTGGIGVDGLGGPADLNALERAIDRSVVASPPNDPLVTSQIYGDTPIIAITFTLQDAGRAERASLIFDRSAFLSRAMTANRWVSSTLETTDEFTGPSTLGGSTEPVVIESADGDRIESRTPIDVFGTTFELRTVASGDLLETVDETSLWILLIAGGIASFGLYAALRSLSRSRQNAWESARTANRQRAALDRRLRAGFELAPIGMAEVAVDGTILEVNQALCRQVGRDEDAIVGRSLSSLVHETDRESHVTRVEALIGGETDAIQGEHRYRHDDGREVWVHESISVINADPGEPRSLLVQSQDITAQRRAAWELAQQALHDELTGLPNRALFLNRLKHALIRAERQDSQVAVMFVDIDRFKIVNDSLGHDMGDRFLVQIAERIGTALRSGDTVARFGGDEFVVLCEGVSGVSEATAAAQRIQTALNEPFDLEGSQTYATASIGITLSTEADDSADALLRDADAAMYRAKDAGRNRFEVFDHSMRSTLVARMEIESQLRTALENGEIVMHYQAIVDPATAEPAGYEALIRWNHPEKGLLGPSAFLGVAEEAGLIHLIDSFALRSVCHQIASWVEDFPAARNLYLTTNWSARNLGRFVQQVEHVLEETRINPNQLVIEVTEGFLLEDGDASVLALQQLKQLGVQIAIDDFGTGYSSLAYLTQFAVDYLKIDKSFVSKLPDDQASAAVIGAIADMATRLGIKLVAEGVETDEQIEMLATLGSPRLQGYRFAKPRPVADIEYYLAQRSGLLESMVREAEHLLAEPTRGALTATRN